MYMCRALAMSVFETWQHNIPRVHLPCIFIYLYIIIYHTFVCVCARTSVIILLYYLYPRHGNRGRNEMYDGRRVLNGGGDKPERSGVDDDRYLPVLVASCEIYSVGPTKSALHTFHQNMAKADRRLPALMVFAALGTYNISFGQRHVCPSVSESGDRH